jgi:hypothetical protein
MATVGNEPGTIWLLGKFANLWKRNGLIRLILEVDDNVGRFLLIFLLALCIAWKVNLNKWKYKVLSTTHVIRRRMLKPDVWRCVLLPEAVSEHNFLP